MNILIKIAKTLLLWNYRKARLQKKSEAHLSQIEAKQPDKKLVSILVPVYNVAPFLAECLNSLLNQSYQNIEIICVNDASTDHSLEILNVFAAKDERVRVITKAHNEGLPQARKTALTAANGAYVLNIDSDDWVDSKMVESLYYLAQEGYDVVVCDYIKERPETSEVVRQPKVLEEGDKLVRIKKRSFAFGNTIWNRLIKREIAEQVVFPVANAGEDIVINAQIYFYAERIAYFAKPLYHWRMNPKSMTNRLNETTFDELKRNYGWIYLFCQEKFGANADKIKPLYEKRLAKIHRKP